MWGRLVLGLLGGFPVEVGCFWCTRGLGGLTGSQLLPGCAGVVVPGEVRLLWSFKLARGFLAGQPLLVVAWVACSLVEVGLSRSRRWLSN